jgi:exocyst complex protein 7
LCSQIDLLVCRPLIENSKAPGKYVKHTPEQLELLLGNLFEGKQERA